MYSTLFKYIFSCPIKQNCFIGSYYLVHSSWIIVHSASGSIIIAIKAFIAG
jgi:hypothetical protein